MRTLLEAANTNAAARDAVDLFVYQLIKQLGAMIAVLGGLDTLVFTGGIGEHAARSATALSRQSTILRRRDLVIPTDENLMIARHTLRLLRAG